MKSLLKNCCVCQGGRILPWGMIRILNNQVIKHPDDNCAGLAYWSPELILFGDDKHYAKIVAGNLVVFNTVSYEQVLIVSEDSLFIAADVLVQEVVESYLFTTGLYGHPPFQDVDWGDLLEALKESSAAKPFVNQENRPIIRVSEELEGEELILLDLNLEVDEESYKLFTYDGKAVDFKIEHPAKLFKWLPDSLFYHE